MFYPIENLAMSLDGGMSGARSSGGVEVEFLPELMGRRILSFFTRAAVADDGAYVATGGMRVFFGPDGNKPLIRRHREDDPVHSFRSGSPSALGSMWIPVR